MQQRAGMPEGRLVAVDPIQVRPALREYIQPLLESSRYGLSGQPDRVMEMPHGGWVSIDIKNKMSSHGGKPFESHVAQVAVYCLLVEDVYQRTVSHGVIEYKDGPIHIPFDDQLRNWILGVTRSMQQMKQKNLIANRNHHHRQRCAKCSYRVSCTQALR